MDAILYWNDVALEANRISHTNGKGEQTGPTLSSRALAIVHLAMYDALAGGVRQSVARPSPVSHAWARAGGIGRCGGGRRGPCHLIEVISQSKSVLRLETRARRTPGSWSNGGS